MAKRPGIRRMEMAPAGKTESSSVNKVFITEVLIEVLHAISIAAAHVADHIVGKDLQTTHANDAITPCARRMESM